jgi:hypothetical protein
MTASKIVAISPHTQNKCSGHLLADEVYYYRFMRRFYENFEFHVCDASREHLKECVGSDEHLIAHRPYRRGVIAAMKYLSKVDPARNSHIIFFGYCELLVLMALLRYSKNKALPITLVSTNNIGRARLRNAPIRFRLFFLACSWRRVNLVVHTRAECQLFRAAVPNYQGAVYVRKHQLLSPRGGRLKADTVTRDELTIGFIGPARREKPLRSILPFLVLLQQAGHNLRFCRLSDEDYKLAVTSGIDPDGLRFSTGYLTESDYDKFVERLDVIVLPHTPDFEGKLSGLLCDAIAHRKVIISRGMEPVKSFEQEFGCIGPRTEFSPTDAVRVETEIRNNLPQYLLNLEAIAAAYRQEEIDRNLNEVISAARANLTAPPTG